MWEKVWLKPSDQFEFENISLFELDYPHLWDHISALLLLYLVLCVFCYDLAVKTLFKNIKKYRWGLHGSDLFLHVPRMLDWIGIWGTRRPGWWFKLFVVILGLFLSSFCCTLSCWGRHSAIRAMRESTWSATVLRWLPGHKVSEHHSFKVDTQD